jgi:hypothetical protein
MYCRYRSVILLASVLLLPLTALREVEGGALPLTSSNIDQVIADNQLVLINFYADWCRQEFLLFAETLFLYFFSCADPRRTAYVVI